LTNKVKEFIEFEEAKLEKNKENEKSELLINLGLYEELYSDTERDTDDYPFEGTNGKYYKKVACETTDDEFNKIIKFTSQNEVVNNKVSSTLLGIAYTIYIIGAIAGFAGGTTYLDNGEFSIVVALSIWVSAFLSGTLFLAFGEVLKLLHKISCKL
jgi:hypothetical protein